MKKIIYITVILIATSWMKLFGCSCSEINHNNVVDLRESSNYVVIGKAFSNVEMEADLKSRMDSRNFGSNVLFRVDSVLKGNLRKGDIVFIFQYSGSCTRDFSFNESFIVFGTTISRFKIDRKRYKEYMPPAKLLDGGELKISAHKKVVRFLNKQTRTYPTMTTSLCQTLYQNKENMMLFEK